MLPPISGIPGGRRAGTRHAERAHHALRPLRRRAHRLPGDRRATERAAALRDRRWRELLDQHHALVREQLARFRGREIDTAGDAFLASFDGPARAVRCACTLVAELKQLGLSIRVGLHAGECERIGDKLGGIAVHTGARGAALAGPGEVWVSGTVKDLVAGSGIAFEDRGVQALKGVPGEWHLYAVASA